MRRRHESRKRHQWITTASNLSTASNTTSQGGRRFTGFSVTEAPPQFTGRVHLFQGFSWTLAKPEYYEKHKDIFENPTVLAWVRWSDLFMGWDWRKHSAPPLTNSLDFTASLYMWDNVWCLDVSNAHILIQIHCPSPKKVALAFCKRSPFVFIKERICCGIVSTTLSNVTTFISIQSCIHYWPRFCIDDRRVEPFLLSFLLTPNTFSGVKVSSIQSIHVWNNSCVKMTLQAPSHSLPPLFHN